MPQLTWLLESALSVLWPLSLFIIPLALGLLLALVHRVLFKLRLAIVSHALTAMRSKGEL